MRNWPGARHYGDQPGGALGQIVRPPSNRGPVPKEPDITVSNPLQLVDENIRSIEAFYLDHENCHPFEVELGMETDGNFQSMTLESPVAYNHVCVSVISQASTPFYLAIGFRHVKQGLTRHSGNDRDTLTKEQLSGAWYVVPKLVNTWLVGSGEFSFGTCQHPLTVVVVAPVSPSGSSQRVFVTGVRSFRL